MKKAVVIIPTYNERENIGELLEVLEEVFKKVSGWKMEILVVDDSSPDGTAKEVRRVMKRFRDVHLLLNKKKMGLGGAYMAGMSEAFGKMKAEVVLEFDADFSHDPQKIPEFMNKIDAGSDLVMGSRYIPGGSIPSNWGLHRKFLSRGGNLFINCVMLDFSIRDWTTGYRAIRKWVYEKVKNQITEFKGYTFQISFLYFARKAGAKVAEVPIDFVDRARGKSKMGFEYVKHTLIFIVKMRVKEILTPQFIKFCVVGFIGFVVNSVGLEVFYRLGLTPGVAAAIGAEGAIISNFTLNNVWTFKEKQITVIGKLVSKFVQFNLTSGGALIIQAIVVGVGTGIFGDQWRMLFLVIAIGFFIIPYNYFMYTRLIWKTKKSKALGKVAEVAG
jgi:dolichol-phosphate mannosyltransferase